MWFIIYYKHKTRLKSSDKPALVRRYLFPRQNFHLRKGEGRHGTWGSTMYRVKLLIQDTAQSSDV